MDIGRHDEIYFQLFRSTMAYVEKIGGLLYNLRHNSDLNLDVDAPDDALGQGFHRLKVSNQHTHLDTNLVMTIMPPIRVAIFISMIG